MPIAGDIADAAHCRRIVADVVDRFGRIDILVNNAAHQAVFDRVKDIPDAEWRRSGRQDEFQARPQALAYATTKGAIQNFSSGLAQMLADRGIRVNSVAPGPVWTSLIPASMPPDRVAEFGTNYPMGWPAQPGELASAYVMLPEPMSGYVSGATIAVTGGKPMI